MNYFLDTEFHEYQKKPFLAKPIDTIELISIGIVAEDGREYYAVCKDFDLKAAWNNECLKDNVLYSIFKDWQSLGDLNAGYEFNFKNFRNFLRCYGVSKKTIATSIKEFCYNQSDVEKYEGIYKSKPLFYAYYADYDWVIFCWLFGRMIDLPKGFPMFCMDLKQMLDEKLTIEEDGVVLPYSKGDLRVISGIRKLQTLEERLAWCKNIYKVSGYPHQQNERNALDDAKWNLKLCNFIKEL